MKVDPRPFFVLTVANHAVKCLRPKFNGRSVGVGGSVGSVGVVNAVATHTVKVFAPLPAALKDGALVTIDDTSPAGRYRVLQIGTTPAGATLYLSDDPAQGNQPYKPDATGTPRTGQKLPYVDSGN